MGRSHGIEEQTRWRHQHIRPSIHSSLSVSSRSPRSALNGHRSQLTARNPRSSQALSTRSLGRTIQLCYLGWSLLPLTQHVSRPGRRGFRLCFPRLCPVALGVRVAALSHPKSAVLVVHAKDRRPIGLTAMVDGHDETTTGHELTSDRAADYRPGHGTTIP